MIGKIFITRSGYDPQLGKHVKDPYLGANPTLGACRPDVRRQLNEGDHIFVISGKKSPRLMKRTPRSQSTVFFSIP
jgi:hypothetical protein